LPLTIDEFPNAARNYPIVFSVGDNSVPLILMGLNEGVNTFMGEDGKFTEPAYVPAYVRRYPFLLAKLQPDAEELSLKALAAAYYATPTKEGWLWSSIRCRGEAVTDHFRESL